MGRRDEDPHHRGGDDGQLTLDRVSSESVREGTGRGWEEWLAVLDAAGARDWDHKQIVAHLKRERPEVSAWWRQSITVGYERARGKRSWARPRTWAFRSASDAASPRP